MDIYYHERKQVLLSILFLNLIILFSMDQCMHFGQSIKASEKQSTYNPTGMNLI